MLIIHPIILQILYVQSFIMIKTLFQFIQKWESGTLQKWGTVCNVTDIPPGKVCNERGKICNVANLPPWGKVCNVADLPGEGPQCCRSSGGEGLQGGRSAIQHRHQVSIKFPGKTSSLAVSVVLKNRTQVSKFINYNPYFTLKKINNHHKRRGNKNLTPTSRTFMGW